MNTTKDEFLTRVRAAQRVAMTGGQWTPAQAAHTQAAHAYAPYPLPELPRFATPHGDRLARFCANLTTMGGEHVALDSATALPAWLAERFPGVVLVSATPEATSAAPLDLTRPPAHLHDVEVGIVRARYGVAETGSLWLSEAEYGVNALGYLVQHLVVLLDPAAIVDGLQDIYRLPDFHEARYAVLVTGPSATADIEGVLIQGAQGVRSLTVILTAANCRAAENSG
ncbi:hypothetical protein PTE30175_03062 [Pandoraea terrae]|uniref:LUD domain-containing protein n=1 Tax=Pandoraea terrae TaxID=1537710 RepID=A0A5E4WBZ9_9BURK|nr:LUD domain-containing protein [Pandoraea terrae]VVE21184.1 hypothetical protein PTE30175_03062 [Pandoraea terrae]